MRIVVGRTEDAHDPPMAADIRRVPTIKARVNPATPMHARPANTAEKKEEYVMSEIEWILGREYETRGVGVVRYVAYAHIKPVYKHNVVQVNDLYKGHFVDKNGRHNQGEEREFDVISGPLPVEKPIVEICGNCRFWLKLRESIPSDGFISAQGNCRLWPKFYGKLDAEWCGQWEAKR